MKTLDIVLVHEGISVLNGPTAFSWDMYFADGAYMGPQDGPDSFVKRIVDPGDQWLGWFTIMLRL